MLAGIIRERVLRALRAKWLQVHRRCRAMWDKLADWQALFILPYGSAQRRLQTIHVHSQLSGHTETSRLSVARGTPAKDPSSRSQLPASSLRCGTVQEVAR